MFKTKISGVFNYLPLLLSVFIFTNSVSARDTENKCDAEKEFECSNGTKSVCCSKDGEVCSPLGSSGKPGPACISETCESLGNLSCGTNPKECCPNGWTCSVDENGAGHCEGACEGGSFPCTTSSNCCDTDQICVEEDGEHKCKDPEPNPRCEDRDPPHLPCGERCCPVGVNCQEGIDAAGKKGVCCQPGWSWNAELGRCYPPVICKAADNNEDYGCGEGTDCCGGSLTPANCCEKKSQICCGSGACCPKGSSCCPDGSCAPAGKSCDEPPPDGR